MFADFVGERGAGTGQGDLVLGGAFGATFTWRTKFADGAPLFYLATERVPGKREIGYGTFSLGTPDKITDRTVIASTQGGDPVDWQAGDEYFIHSVPVGEFMAAVVNGGLGTALPGWAPAGWMRLDNTDAAFWIKKRLLAGTTESEEGRHHIAAAIFAASQRTLFVDKGAAGYTFTAADIGKTLCFDTTASARVLTMLANDATGMGHGAYVYVMPYGSSSNGVTFTPGGSDTADLATAPPLRRTLFMWDGAKNKWRSDYVTPSTAVVYPAGTITGLAYSNNVGDATNDIDIAAGGCMDATGAYWMVLSALTKQLDAAWAVGTAAGGLDTGSIGNSDYYIWAIARSDTGVTDVLFSLSSTAPTMPASYDYKRLIGWFKRVGGAIVAFHTYEGDGGSLDFAWDSPTLDIDLASTLTNSRRTDAVKVPLNFSVVADIHVRLYDASVNYTAFISCPDRTDVAPSLTVAPLATAGSVPTQNAHHVFNMQVRTSAAGLIAARADIATVDQYSVATLGFRWARR